jgi:nitrite reductase/ring-hydroxylating ferredoxin subunit
VSDHSGFDEALEQILADRSPRRALESLSPEERRMVRMAQLLRGTQGGEPSPVFREALAERIAAEPRRISRRSAVFSSVAALAAGILAGFGLDRFLRRPASTTSGWVSVALADRLPDGAVRPFDAGKVHGVLIRENGRFRAMSRLCTDIGCPLNVSGNHKLVCPCHGAEFDLHGRSLVGLGGPYSEPLPPLPQVKVQVRDNSVEVWTG